MRIYNITSEKKRLKICLEDIGVDKYALRSWKKGVSLNILIKDIISPACNILKQEAIASGMDVSVNRNVISCNVEYSDALISGNINSYNRLVNRLRMQPFGLKDLAVNLENILNLKKKKYFTTRGKRINLSKPLVMGILNLTPDSFSDGGSYTNEREISYAIDNMLELGVDIIDIGGMSSRPGSDHIDSEEEIKRISYGLKYAVKSGAQISIDSCNYETVNFAVNEGVILVNDITGGEDEKILSCCSKNNVAICIMHMNGKPKNMQENISYNNIIEDIKDFFDERVERALTLGINRESIIIDVGFGFGKSKEQNYQLLKYLNEFNIIGLPQLVGISRKGMLGVVTGSVVSDRLISTVAANSVALLNGADIIRVHDVKEGIETVKIIDSIRIG